ncbi:MAG: hypothetical protein ABI457_13625 [Hyphomicrobium sp.]
MNTFMVRSEEDALRALLGLNSNHFLDMKFVGYPLMLIDAEDRIDAMRNRRRLDGIQAAVERQYCLIKYGTRDLRRLRAPEREAVHVPAVPLRGGKQMLLDFSNAANAMLAAIRENLWKAGSWKPGPDLYAALGNYGALAATGIATVKELGPERLQRIAVLAVLVGMPIWGAVEGYEAYLADQRVPERLAHQERMKELDRTTIVRLDGTRATQTAALEKALTAENDAEQRKFKLLSEMELEHPLVKFVVAEAEEARPLVLGLAPKTGKTAFNAREMPAQAIRAWAKQLQQASLAKRRRDGGWITEVRKGPIGT